MSSIWGNKVKISIFGESHSKSIGVVVDGFPAGIKINMEELLHFMARRSSKGDVTDTPRIEKDFPNIMSGIVDGVTCGTPICAVIENQNIKSKDYENIRQVARPSHADYTGYVRYKGNNDIRGGGHFSGRLTAPLVFAGGICKQYLENRGINIYAHIKSIKNIQDKWIDKVNPEEEILKQIKTKSFPTIDDEKGKEMIELIKYARDNNDAVGGVIECAVCGIRAGYGSPMFSSAESMISSMMFSIPAVKGIEFGSGYDITQMYASKSNDVFRTDGAKIYTTTNHNGGILGGITNGMPIIFTTAIKPTASISRQQDTVNFVTKENTKIEVEGRHDPCIVKRAVACIEAGTAIAITNLLFETND